MQHYVGNLETAQFQPFPHPADPSLSAGEFAWIKEDRVSFWRANESNMPQVAPYPFLREEIIHVLEGAVEIEIEGGETVSLKEGDVASFDKGLNSTWTFTFPFTKLSVLAD